MKTTENKPQKQQRRILLIWLLIIALFAYFGATAQTKVKRSETGIFCSELSPKDSTFKRSGEVYKDGSGILYPIYISKSGKYFVIHTSKKTGKSYRHYLLLTKEDWNK